MSKVPESRIRAKNDKEIRSDGEYVLYWMNAFRRVTWNFSLQRAIEHAEELEKPLVVLEALRSEYPWASDRIHAFIIEGMEENQKRLADKDVVYYPYLEEEKGAGKGLLEALGERACVVVTDHFPAFFLPRMVEAAAKKLDVLLEAIDSNGIFPLSCTDRVFTKAHSFRRFLQKNIAPHLNRDEAFPLADPFEGCKLPTLNELPVSIVEGWPLVKGDGFSTKRRHLKRFPIDHDVAPVSSLPGGTMAAEERFSEFLEGRLKCYHEERNQVEDSAASGLSPYLHFGHISSHQIVAACLDQEEWSVDDLAEKASGSRHGWWGMSEATEAFFDEIITWREVGFNMCELRPDDYDDYISLPDWAKTTLEAHMEDERPYVYTLKEFEEADTHDQIWNAAQRQLRRDGVIHNYLRMLWGKKILEWTETPQDALAVMLELNNKYALDGRDPNSYSGIFWCLGRYDRAWGPERAIFGKVRFMSSDSTKRKLKLKDYLKRYEK